MPRSRSRSRSQPRPVKDRESRKEKHKMRTSYYERISSRSSVHRGSLVRAYESIRAYSNIGVIIGF
jgi:hypothetical protein